MRPGIFQGQKGSILILALSILVLLSIFTAAVGRTVQQRLKKIERLEDRAELRSIAESGIKKVRYILKRDEQKGGPDSLLDNWSQSDLEFLDIPVGQGSFTILGDKFNATQNMIEGREESAVHGAVDEERKININKTSSPEILTRLFQAAGGISYEEANQIALSLLDWRDADDNPYDLGAEAAFYR